MIFVFVLVVTSVVTGIHLYLWRRLVLDTMHRSARRRAAGFGILGLALLAPATMIGTRTLPHDYQRWLAWPGYLWLSLMFYLLVTLLVLELPRLALRGWTRTRTAPIAAMPSPAPPGASAQSPRSARSARSDAPPTELEPPTQVESVSEVESATVDAGTPPVDPAFDRSRRLLLGRGMAAVAGLTALTATGVGIGTALGPPDLRRVAVRLPKLPASMDGFRIALVSDIHLGPLLGRSHTERIVRIINGVDADVVAVVGDLVDGTVEELGEAAEPLQDLRARHGSFFVTGNHEYFSGHDAWIEEVDSLGLTVLRNQRVDIDGLDLAGVNDLTGESYSDGPDFTAALAGRETDRPVVLLAHQPIQVHEAAKHGVDLQLSGHTHGGQMLPFHLLVKLQQPVLAGLDTVDGTQVYVTRGAGFWGPPVRIGAPPDISVIELRAS